MAAIVYYQDGRRKTLNDFYEKNVFGLDSTIGNAEQALFLAALGADKPVESLGKRDNGGWFRTEALNENTRLKALISAFLLGTAEQDSDFNEYIKQDNYIKYFERCAEAGFQAVEKKLQDADWDNEVLERKMMKTLEMLYLNYVEDDIE